MELIILQSQSAGLANLLFFGGILLVMYFFFIRPQVKKQKAQNAFVQAMAKGDEVVTNSGIIGKINKFEDDAVTLQVDQKTFIRVVPSAISKEMTEGYKGGDKESK